MHGASIRATAWPRVTARSRAGRDIAAGVLAGLVVVLVGLDQAGQDRAEFADVAGGQRLDEVAPDSVGVPGPRRRFYLAQPQT